MSSLEQAAIGACVGPKHKGPLTRKDARAISKQSPAPTFCALQTLLCDPQEFHRVLAVSEGLVALLDAPDHVQAEECIQHGVRTSMALRAETTGLKKLYHQSYHHSTVVSVDIITSERFWQRYVGTHTYTHIHTHIHVHTQRHITHT